MTAAPLIINGTAAPPSTSDIFSGFDTFGWPPEPPPWINPQRGSLLVVLTLYAAYNPATDVRRAVQAKFLSTPETFVLPQVARPLIINGTAATPYNPATDVQRLSQPKLFAAPEVFIQPQTAKPLLINGSAPPYNAGIDVQRLAQPKIFSIPEAFINPWLPRPLLINGTAPIPYNPATDVQRARMAITFSTPEIFPRSAPFNQLIVNGQGAPVPPQPTIIRVQAAIAGSYGGVFCTEGDVFDINAADFSDSTVSFVPVGNPDYPLFGWMTVVPPTTPLFSWAASGLSSPVTVPPRRLVL